MRSSWFRAGSSIGSTPSGTSSGRRVIAAKRAQKVLDVRLVTGAAPPQHVGVDDDERIGHAASS
jgi:hypothetical protein